MSDIIIRKGYKNEVQRNTPIQERLDENIQNFLNVYKYYEEKEEFKQNTGKDFDLIISHKSTIPDLVIFNKEFNKNNCFTDANTKEINSFPRIQFYIRFNKKDKEQYSNLKKNKQNKQNKFNIEKNIQSETSKKENNTKESNLNIEKKEDNNNKNQENEDEEERENEEDDDEENEEKSDDDEEEDEKENDSKKDEKKEESEGEEVKNNEEKKNNETNKTINFYIPINTISKQNNNNNQNIKFPINDNLSTASNTSKIIEQNTKINDNISNLDDISYDGSIINNINNMMDSVSVSQSQFGNESLLMNPNPLNKNNVINMNNNNIGFNNINNNNLLQLLLNQSQINNNNQFNNFNNNNLLGLIGNNPLNLYNQTLPFQNNLNLQNNLLTQYILKYWTVRGWLVFIKEGSKFKQINSFTSFDLFTFLNQKITENVKVDDYIITTENKEQKYTGGIMYLNIVKIFPTVFNILKDQSLKQIGLNNMILNQNNNNFGLNNTNILNNLNNNNFLMNNFNNNNFNFNQV